jgi:hypothetical protein
VSEIENGQDMPYFEGTEIYDNIVDYFQPPEPLTAEQKKRFEETTVKIPALDEAWWNYENFSERRDITRLSVSFFIWFLCVPCNGHVELYHYMLADFLFTYGITFLIPCRQNCHDAQGSFVRTYESFVPCLGLWIMNTEGIGIGKREQLKRNEESSPTGRANYVSTTRQKFVRLIRLRFIELFGETSSMIFPEYINLLPVVADGKFSYISLVTLSHVIKTEGFDTVQFLAETLVSGQMDSSRLGRAVIPNDLGTKQCFCHVCENGKSFSGAKRRYVCICVKHIIRSTRDENIRHLHAAHVFMRTATTLLMYQDAKRASENRLRSIGDLGLGTKEMW